MKEGRPQKIKSWEDPTGVMHYDVAPPVFIKERGIVLTPDGRPPQTESEMKAASLSPVVRSYVYTGILAEQKPEKRDRYLSARRTIADMFTEKDYRELNEYRAWEARWAIQQDGGVVFDAKGLGGNK